MAAAVGSLIIWSTLSPDRPSNLLLRIVKVGGVGNGVSEVSIVSGLYKDHRRN
jgi:hypothetical protein